MAYDFSGNVVVSGNADKVYEFIQAFAELPDGYEPWDNGGDCAYTSFQYKAEFNVDFWKKASNGYPELKFVAKYQEELAAAYICTIQAGKVVLSIRFDWNDGDIMPWSD